MHASRFQKLYRSSAWNLRLRTPTPYPRGQADHKGSYQLCPTTKTINNMIHLYNDLPRTRTWSLRLRGPTPYPLGQRTHVFGQAQEVCRSASFTDMRWQSNTCKAMAKPWPARLGFEPGPRARGTSTRPLGQPFLKGTGSLYHDTRACLTKRA